MKKFKFLVFIDDDHATNVYHEMVVKLSGLCEQYKFFAFPEKALEFFAQLAQEEDPLYPDAIFLDINMPVLTGWEFINEYQKLSIPTAPVIIMLTSSQHRRDLEKGNRIEIVHQVIPKPLDKTHLETIRQELLETPSLSNEK